MVLNDYVPIFTEVGNLIGRSAIFLDQCKFIDLNGNKSITFTGEFAAASCSNCFRDDDFIGYRLTMRNVVHLISYPTEYMTCRHNYQSSFALRRSSPRLEALGGRGHIEYLLITYDETFEIVASSYELEVL